METVIGIEGSEEGSEESYIQDSEPINPPQVDFDGRLVPATDDELMEVEEFFDYESSEIFSIADDVQTDGCGLTEDYLLDMPLSGGDEGFLQYENYKVAEDQLNAKIEYGEETQLTVTEENRHHQSASFSPVHSSARINIGPGIDLHDNLPIMDNVDPIDILGHGILSMSPSILHDTRTIKSGNHEDCSNMQEEATENGMSAYLISTSLRPDFPLLMGEINLNKLTIRELQEAFRSTFGRGTSVKDKQWLKRRISIGLADSCDVPLTSFIIKDNKLVKKVEDANCEKADDLSVEEIGVSGDVMKDVQVNCHNNTEDASRTPLRNLTENGSKDHSPFDQRTVKRVRKPTKRYIEELSDMETQETIGRLVPSAKHFGVTKDLSKSAVRPAWGVGSSAVLLRPDLLAGSGVQVPCVSRIRRCHPRKSIITFKKLQPSRMGRELVRDATGVGGAQLDNIRGHDVAEARVVPFGELPSEEKSERKCSQTYVAEVTQEQEPKSVNSSGNNSVSTFTTKGEMRRKHHRAWSLSEVVKLVDGVSRYGVGRWSEIKRISFASYSYRTSVDLKDKWRNLLKASFAAMSSKKEMNHQRKPTSMPIPTPILLKVRELAEMNGQTPGNFKTSS